MADGEAKVIKVLSIDGGGIRGIIPAIILTELQKRLGKDLTSVFDLIAGTSTGGIIAVGIGAGCKNGKPYAPQELVDLYVQNGAQIFQKNFFTPISQLFGPKYSAGPLENILAKFFGETDLASAFTPLLVSSYDLQSQLPFFFKSHKIDAKPEYNWKIREVARATSAAPTFFPPHYLKSGNSSFALVDGGVFVNNPSMAAYVEARTLYPEASRIIVVSVGTGDRNDSISYDQAKNWGLLGWARQIAPVLMDSVSEAVDFELRALPQCAYYRLQIEHLQGAIAAMDNVSPGKLDALRSPPHSTKSAPSSKLVAVVLFLAPAANPTE
jgi:uncharacterized protein